MIDNTKLGFSTGVLHKTHRTKDALKIMKDLGYDTVELGFVKLNRIEEGWLEELSEKDLGGFEHISFHAPVFNYGKNEGTDYIFKKIEKINNMRKLDAVVFHPDPIEDFGVFHEVNFNVALENMDNRKNSYHKAKDFDEIFSQTNKYKLVLDVNHIYTNDASMELAKSFYQKLKDRIVEIHLSGYAGYHEPLFQTKQVNIIKAVQNIKMPIIIESLLSLEDLEKERNYILKNLKQPV